MKKLVFGAAVTLIFASVISFASENNPRNCTSQEVTGYSNKSELVLLTATSGILHIEGESARALYVQLSSKEEPGNLKEELGNPKEVITKIGTSYICFKQSVDDGSCAFYQCQFAVGDSSTGKIGF